MRWSIVFSSLVCILCFLPQAKGQQPTQTSGLCVVSPLLQRWLKVDPCTQAQMDQINLALKRMDFEPNPRFIVPIAPPAEDKAQRVNPDKAPKPIPRDPLHNPKIPQLIRHKQDLPRR